MSCEKPADPAGQQRDFDDALRRACSALGLEIGRRENERMFAHFLRMVEVNEHLNLTRITAPGEAAAKHYADSLALLATPWVDVGRPLTVLDVGTGAGFPAIPLAIVCPQWRIIAIDGRGKKIRFLADVAGQLGLSNLEAIQSRASGFLPETQQRPDLVVFRAVGKIGECLHEVGHLARSAGAILFYKTPHMEQPEMKEGLRRATRMGLTEPQFFEAVIPTPQGSIHRRLVRFERRPQ